MTLNHRLGEKQIVTNIFKKISGNMSGDYMEIFNLSLLAIYVFYSETELIFGSVRLRF